SPHRVPRHTLFPYTTLFRSLRQNLSRRIDLPRAVVRADELRSEIDGVILLSFRAAETARNPEVLGAGFLALFGARNDKNKKAGRSEEHTSEFQSREKLVCRL